MHRNLSGPEMSFGLKSRLVQALEGSKTLILSRKFNQTCQKCLGENSRETGENSCETGEKQRRQCFTRHWGSFYAPEKLFNKTLGSWATISSDIVIRFSNFLGYFCATVLQCITYGAQMCLSLMTCLARKRREGPLHTACCTSGWWKACA